MIAKLTGHIDSIETDHLILDVGGIGFMVFSTEKCLTNLHPEQSPFSFFIDTVVRQDGIAFYGFLDPEERVWFRHLLTVQGVGSKAALAILNIFDISDLCHSIADGQKERIVRADGVGPKLASRILVELKDKAMKYAGTPTKKTQLPMNNNHFDDAMLGLQRLGYKPAEIQRAFEALKNRDDHPNLGAQDIIRASLMMLSKMSVG